MTVCSTTHLYHYLLSGTDATDSILQRGLLPLSAMPESPRWASIEQARPGFFRQLYDQMAEPILRKPYTNSGVFLTPIDFRRLADLPAARLTRIAIPFAAIDASQAVLTYVLDDERKVFPLSALALEETARLWTEPMVRSWFGRNPSMLFFHVPQVAAYQDGGIPVQADWVHAGGN